MFSKRKTGAGLPVTFPGKQCRKKKLLTSVKTVKSWGFTCLRCEDMTILGKKYYILRDLKRQKVMPFEYS